MCIYMYHVDVLAPGVTEATRSEVGRWQAGYAAHDDMPAPTHLHTCTYRCTCRYQFSGVHI